jgi:outer membrane protein insertion porin family
MRGRQVRVATGALSALIATLLLCFTLAARAEVPPEWFGRRVLEVKVAGEQAGRVDERALGVPVGVPLTRTLVRSAIERLGKQERWANVQVDALESGGGVVLLFHLTARLVAMRIDVTGNSVLEDREVMRVLGLREESELERDSFAALSEKLAANYAERGYHHARISLSMRDTDDPARKVLRVEIDEGEPTRIHSIRFAGEGLPRRKGFRRVLGFSIGDVADQVKIEEGLNRTESLLRSVGFYAAELSEPTLNLSGYEADLVVPSHIGPHYEVRFHSPGPLSESELFAALALGEERLSSDANLHALEQKLAELYRRYGFREVRVTVTAHREVRVFESQVSGERYEEPTMVLDAEISTGNQTIVDQLSFPGAKHFSSELLEDQVYSYLEEDLPGSSTRFPVDSEVADELGFGGGGKPQARREVPKPIVLDPRHLYYERTYEQALEHLRELYRGDGYLQVKIGPAELKPARDPDHVNAFIPIVEGPRTFIYDVRIEGNRTLASRALLHEAQLERDAPFSQVKLEEARLRIVNAYQKEGYFYARVDPTVRTSDDGTRAEIVFIIEEGYLVRVGGIEVRGAERSRESMILNRVRFKPGDLFKPETARATQDVLLTLDVFTSVTVSLDQPELPARVKNLVISVTERKSQWLGWSAGFSTGEGVRGGFEYGYRNLFGAAVHSAFRGQLGYQFVFLDAQIQHRYESLSTDKRIEYQATFSFGAPYIPHLPRINLGLDVVFLADIQRDFRMQKNSIVTSAIYRPHRRWTFTLAEELEGSDFYLFASQELQTKNNIGNLNTTDLVPVGQNKLLSTQFVTAWDMRDKTYNPRKGFLVSLNSEWAKTVLEPKTEVENDQGTTSEVTFHSNMLRFLGSAAFYIPILPKLVFASQWRYGRVVHLTKNSQSYPNRRFYLGGTNFRGFNQNQMIPQDLQDCARDPSCNSVNTTNVVSHGGEVFLAGQNELRFPLLGDLYGGLFADVGNLWANPHKFNIRQLETVVGAGLRFQTPVASLAFDYGVRAVHTGPFDFVGAFQFAFQTF